MDEITVIHPMGGEGLINGSSERIHWDAYGNSGTFSCANDVLFRNIIMRNIKNIFIDIDKILIFLNSFIKNFPSNKHPSYHTCTRTYFI